MESFILSEKEEHKLLKLWNNCSKTNYRNNVGHAGSSSTIDELFHATTKENREAILEGGEFFLPSRKYAIENGLKLGAAVYFGSEPEYCLREALNTEANKGKQIVLIKVIVELECCIDLGIYDSGNNLHLKDWEWMTERLSKVEAKKFGFDSLCINKCMNSFEVALFEPRKQINSLSPF